MTGRLLRRTAMGLMLAFSSTSFAQNLERTIAFLGDQGTDNNACEVLKLAKSEDTDLLVLLGDFDYEGNPSKWKHLMETCYGGPFIAALGEDDVLKGVEYRQILKEIIEKHGLDCEGKTGTQAKCSYAGIEFFISGFKPYDGNFDDDFDVDKIDDGYERLVLESSPGRIKICVWSGPPLETRLTSKQLSSKPFSEYNACAMAGALIVAGDDHLYGRSFTADEHFEIIDTTLDVGHISKGQTMVLYSGLGGKSTDKAVKNNGRWSHVYDGEGAEFGALFLKTNGDCTAEMYFRTIQGEVVDQFGVNFDSCSMVTSYSQ